MWRLIRQHLYPKIDIIVRYIYRKIGLKTYREILCIIVFINVSGGIAAMGSDPLEGHSCKAAAWAAADLAWAENLAQAICSSSYSSCSTKNRAMAMKSSRNSMNVRKASTFRAPAWFIRR